MASSFRTVCFIVCLYLLVPYTADATDTSFVDIVRQEVKSGKAVHISLNKNYVGLAIKIRNGSFDHAYLVLKTDTFMLHPYHEDVPEDGFTLSQPIINSNFYENIKLYTGQIDGEIELHFFKPLPKSTVDFSHFRPATNGVDNCGMPTMIGRDVWRKGLAGPTVAPSCTDAEHIIVHHSAIESTTMDYTQQVRFIYGLHTNSNGWDDIGYNYLIALDGSIYEGRDGRGVCPDDNVKGAHFCAKNNNTMGICLMGDFNKETPSEAMINSLIKLTSWKLKKEGINPYAVLEFPKGTANQMPVIVGHRDGCNTECPGSLLYKMIGIITDSTYQKINACNVTAIGNGQMENRSPWVYDEHTNVLKIERPVVGLASIRNVLGHVLISFDSKVSEVNVSTLPAGIYFIQDKVTGGTATYKFRKP